MSSSRIPAAQSQAPQTLWEPGAIDLRPEPPAAALRAFPAAFQSPAGPNQRAHSIPASRAAPAVRVAPAEQAGVPAPAHAVRVPAEPVSTIRRDTAVPVVLVDSMGVPGQFCLWIPKDWELVLNVFSCGFQHLRCDTGIPHFRGTLQIMCSSSHTFVSFRPHNISDRGFGANRCARVFISYPLPAVLASRVW
jgi:hypothetical protein